MRGKRLMAYIGPIYLAALVTVKLATTPAYVATLKGPYFHWEN